MDKYDICGFDKEQELNNLHIMELKEIKKEELINVLNEYIRGNYTYDYADIFEDSIVYHLENGEQVFINIDLETESE